MKFKNQKGITLISLVVTIIVILILAGITISMLIGNNGIITRASLANEEYKMAQKREEIEMNKINAYAQPAGTKVADVTNVAGTKVAELIADGNNGTVPVPTDYYFVGGTEDYGYIISDNAQDKEKFSGTRELTESDNSKISQLKGNIWVWIPVENAKVMYETGNVNLSGNTGVSTNRYSKTILSNGERGMPGTQSAREPDILSSGDDDTYYSQTGFSSLKEMAQSFVNEYNNMIKSIETYGGFYIGIAELKGTVNSPQSKFYMQTNTDLVNINWYEGYTACKKFGVNKSNITSGMIWRMSMGYVNGLVS